MRKYLRKFKIWVCAAKFCLDSRQLLLYVITQNLCTQKVCLIYPKLAEKLKGNKINMLKG